MKYSSILFCFILSVIFVSCKKEEKLQEELLNDKFKQTLYNMSYGSDNRNTLDIALPKNRTTNTPVVVFITGGAWIFGDKSIFESQIQKFADAGIACATVNYRYASDLFNVHHPDLPNDIKKAVDYIASKSELWKVSGSRFGIVGHSAGGHLALITSYALNDGKIKACASWAGLLNFIDNDQLAVSGASYIIKTYMGFSLNSASDTSAYKEASPFWRVNSASVPTLLIYGTADIGVPYANASRMKNKLDNLGVVNSFITFNGSGHIWFGQDLENATNTTLSWFQSKL